MSMSPPGRPKGEYRSAQNEGTPVSTRTIERLTWVLIFGGLLVLSLGLFVARQSELLGWSLVVFGAADIVAGAVLIWLRSRMKD